ncbi:hypothetical protein AAEX37_01476 [Oligella sp. MSHR50489EDL]
MALRFACAAIALALCSPKMLKGVTLEELKAGALIGICIFLGYSLQTLGLQTIPSSKSAFFNSTLCAIGAFIAMAVFKTTPDAYEFFGHYARLFGLGLPGWS